MIGLSLAVVLAASTRSAPHDRMAWFRNAKLGMFIHWGPVSQAGTEIGWSRGAQVPIETYDNLYKTFDPVNFNADAWMKLAAEAGMRYVVPVTKHHDGFCMWPSTYTPYNISATPFKKDIIGAIAKAAARHHIVFGTYYSILDWKSPDYPTGSPGGTTEKPNPDMARHMKLVEGEVAELIHKYHTRLIWFDGQWEKPYTRTYSVALNDMIRKIDPSIIVNNRVESRDLLASDPHGDYLTPEQTVGSYNTTTPWETCMTLGQQWAYKPGDTYKTSAQVIDTLIETVTGDGNLLLNVGPDSTGEIPVPQQKLLLALGAWLKKYGESIYGTRGGPFLNGAWGGSTRKGNTIYIQVLNWGSGEIVLGGLGAEIKSVTVLQPGVKVDVIPTEKALRIRLMGSVPAEPTTIKITIDRNAWSLGTINPPK